MLAKEAKDISVGDVLRACEGNIEVVSCVAPDNGQACSRAEKCVTKIVWDSVNRAIENAVDSINLKTLIDDSENLGDKQITNSDCIN